MIYSIVPTDVVFFDNTQIRQRHLKMYNNVTLELTDGRVDYKKNIKGKSVQATS